MTLDSSLTRPSFFWFPLSFDMSTTSPSDFSSFALEQGGEKWKNWVVKEITNSIQQRLEKSEGLTSVWSNILEAARRRSTHTLSNSIFIDCWNNFSLTFDLDGSIMNTPLTSHSSNPILKSQLLTVVLLYFLLEIKMHLFCISSSLIKKSYQDQNFY